ncbi:unnamed protein product [Danaus chrysippus]|uniref:(African queen) hypothetical protein n=1 Tax=Danaus chrysippus TaxID=151541 RepID=A0A8J2QFV1_9NEOP|nr:unnamed protein product [Danaus chrysippus]
MLGDVFRHGRFLIKYERGSPYRPIVKPRLAHTDNYEILGFGRRPAEVPRPARLDPPPPSLLPYTSINTEQPSEDAAHSNWSPVLCHRVTRPSNLMFM